MSTTDHDIYANYYTGTVANYYDPAYKADKRLKDIDFWLSLGAPGLHILEAGCGTGGITFPLAQSGASVDGVDFSEDFLAIAARKLELAPAEVRSRATLQKGDIRRMELEKRYDLIIYPFRVVQHLHTFERTPLSEGNEMIFVCEANSKTMIALRTS
jgi:2-polyprenyl-3-methyl-5-hydroxy-6-metoxy-1,4-benzoquinol methylase